MANREQFCTFYLEKHYFGIELLQVQEVLRELELTQVPLAPHAVRGLMNLRGQIVIAVDLRRRLGLPERAKGAAAMNVIVRAGEDAVNLLVDEIGDVVEAGEDSFEPPPETLRGTVRLAIRCVHKLENQLMHVLDTDWACAIEDLAAPAESANLRGRGDETHAGKRVGARLRSDSHLNGGERGAELFQADRYSPSGTKRPGCAGTDD